MEARRKCKAVRRESKVPLCSCVASLPSSPPQNKKELATKALTFPPPSSQRVPSAAKYGQKVTFWKKGGEKTPKAGRVLSSDPGPCLNPFRGEIKLRSTLWLSPLFFFFQAVAPRLREWSRFGGPSEAILLILGSRSPGH